jgi:PST family polysaccharide transporter
VKREVAPLLKLGLAFMTTGLMTVGSAYAVRIIVMRKLGIEATGFYQSAWTLGGLYISFILQAMGADFYPRLTASAHNDALCNRMVNEQARLGLLLAGPGAIATLTFAPVVIALFYSAKFYAAVDVLRWICLGTTLQVVTWPMGFIALAKGRANVFFWSDLAWTAVYLALAWASVSCFGLTGTGIAFFGSYVFHAFVSYGIARRLSGFRWSRENARSGLLALLVVAVVFCELYLLPSYLGVCLGALTAALATGYSIRALLRLMPSERISVFLRRLFPWLCPARV